MKKKYKNLTIIVFIAIITIAVFSNNIVNANTQLQKKHKETKAKIQKLKFLERKETNKLYKNQLKLEQTTKDLTISKQKYQLLKRELEKTQIEYQIAITSYLRYEEASKRRIKQIFKKERNRTLDFLLSSYDFNTLLDRIYFQKVLMKRDKQELDNLKKRAMKIRALKQQIDEQKMYLARTIEQMDSQKRDIKDAIARNENMIHKLKTDRRTYERAERELAQQSAKIQSMISKGTKSGIKVVGGFIWPVRGPITSPFGYRIHPIFKSRTFHSGLDIGAPQGKPIVASNSGKVIYVGWYGGYGKVVIIDHGNYNGQPITTLYAHMSNYCVRVGQMVSKGNTIGYVGSTGYSTGPHCHFEVRVNGKVQNPMNYL